jgi:3',5'-nucleoside bisphosphate phosphatase
VKLYYDLHIHTIASPCADDTMLPHDIAGMALLKGLDVITVLDHVCGVNLAVAAAAAKAHGLLFLPGIEVTTNNGIHMLCYFKTVPVALEFCEMIYNSLPCKNNNTFYFGYQYILDENDAIAGEVEKGLFQKTPYDIWELIGLVAKHDGVVVPAHINRDIHGILSVYDDISEYGFNAVEVKRALPIDDKHLKGKKVFYNSDAHTITSISPPENYIEVDERSVEAVFNCLKY